ncbi:Mitochondrial import inner membrane translocase subunit TIM22 [Hondaea fermentalgiana]|uniref:Mitochondrial import inner membrane translocase subunit TIM22 n=1 Tax=Hondaea fermentalgiana TaxID=2315210 RepID=A0A2R5GCW5_9STRA|nr:Mitochondrial import inner membrane translocase subunit TIM22 [Hondaea fermentalgiana]|eukprot:GBG28415.1 Mitochondrial import inner membrane translocase subunit TIM22 [Hondaea fermentalgiana]
MMTQSQDPTIFTEACVVRAVGSGAVGGLMGAAMGLVLGGYGSIAPPVSMPGVPDPPKVPMKWQLRDSWYSTARRMRRWGKNFGSVTIVFSGVECCIEKYRAQHDIYNGVSAGCITGAVLAAGQGPAGMCIGCAGFAAFSAAVESIMGH